VETVGPYLAPQRIRGRDNEPANVVDVIDELARVRDVDVDTLREATITNSMRAFPRLR
jgi:TatD DNase family protein